MPARSPATTLCRNAGLFVAAVIALAASFGVSRAAPITTCGVIHGTISGPSFIETWTFTGSAGEHVILTAVTTSGALDTQLQLYPPSGPVEAQSLCDIFGCRDQLDVVLAQSGTYTLLVSDNGLNDAGSYDLTLFRFDGPTSCVDDPDGGALTCDQHRSGTISSPTDIDAYQFTGAAGDRVFLTAATTSGALDTRMLVYAPGASTPEPASLCDIFGCRDQLEFQLAASGTYTVLVEDGSLGNTGDYDIYLYSLPCATVAGADPDSGSLACEQLRTGSISPGYDVDGYTFQATAGERVFLTAVTLSGSLDTRIRVFPPGGGPAEVESLCDIFGCRDQLEFQPAVTGSYSVLIQDGGGTNPGTYAVTLFRLPCVDPQPAERDTGVLISDLTRHGGIDRIADFDPYRFYGEAGTRVLISAVTESGPLDTRLSLYPPDGSGAETQSLCDIFGCRDQLEWVLAQTGIYTLLVQDGSSVQKGTYQLTFTKLPGSATTITDMDGGQLVSGDVVAGRIQVASDVDVWRFYGSAGQNAIITATTTSGSLDTRIRVFPPGSGPAEQESVCDIFGCRDQVSFQLAETGLYTVAISDGGETQRGDYSLSLILIPDTPAPGFYHLLPADGQAVPPLQTLGMSWDPVSGATGYDVYFGSDPLGPVPLVAGGIAMTGFTTPVLALDTQYFWRVDALTPGGVIRGPDRRFYAVSSTTGAPGGSPELPHALELSPGRPNPFHGDTRLLLTVPLRARSSVAVFDLNGRLVRTLHDGALDAGVHAFTWDARDARGGRVAPGVYLVRASVGESTRIQKMCVLE
jgi:hypothetical protein